MEDEPEKEAIVSNNFDLIELLSSGLSYAGSLTMIFGGLVPYVPQYRDIKRTENAEGFSLFVCLALLLANTMRILFWFGHPFETPLLLQSIVMNIAMFAMINLCIRVKQRTEIVPLQPRIFTDPKKDSLDLNKSDKISGHCGPGEHEKYPQISRVFLDFDLKYFWAWTDFLSYIECIATFSAAVGAIVYVFIDKPLVIESIGLLALLTEATLGVPQFYRNFKNKSTLGMSKKMVLMWTLGDMFKTFYFIVKKVPQQFWICGTLQIAIDIAIMLQIVFYRITPIPRLSKPGKHIS